MIKRATLTLTALAAMLSSAANARPASDFIDPRDKLMPDAAATAFDWSGKPWWWALGECAQWHRAVRPEVMGGPTGPDDKMMNFITPMLDRLVRDRGVPFDAAMHASRDAMDSGIDPTVRLLGSGMGSVWDEECDALLGKYKAAHP